MNSSGAVHPRHFLTLALLTWVVFSIDRQAVAHGGRIVPENQVSRPKLTSTTEWPAPRGGGEDLPDLVISPETINPHVVFQTFAANSCEVDERCVPPGQRRLLRFNTITQNIGSGDLTLGSPVGNPLFHYAECHNHYHLEGYANYTLRDGGLTVAAGYKSGFCLLDTMRINPNANPTPRYNCSFQGIQAGWADIYSSELPCQYIDITGVSPGIYTLEMEVNPDRILQESDYSNNIITIEVTIPDATPPLNDDFADAITIMGSLGQTSGSNVNASGEEGESPSATSVWWKWNAPLDAEVEFSLLGSSFDTVLSIYRQEVGGSLILIGVNDDCQGVVRQSCLVFPAQSAVSYWIKVDGYFGETGSILLSWASGGSVNDAVFVGNTIPPGLAPGRDLIVGMTVRNMGSTIWSAELGYRLVVLSDPCALFPAIAFLPEGAAVAPNDSFQFVLPLRAPAPPKSCKVHFQMEQADSGVFGELLDLTLTFAVPLNSAIDWTEFN